MSTQTASVPSVTAGPKLASLRAKTDHDLEILLRRTLDHGFQAVSRGDYARAETMYGRAARLIAVVNGLPPWECAPLHARLRELRTALDEPVLAGACPVG